MLDFLFSYSFWIHAIALIGIINTWKIFKESEKKKRRRAQWELNDISNYENQLRFVENSVISCKRLMNKSEYALYRILEERVSRQKGLRLFVQVSLGEVFGTAEDKAFSSINSKRVDFLVINWEGFPVLGIECNGGGHYQGNAAERDEVKRQIFANAGVPLVEISFQKISDLDKSKVISKINPHLQNI